MDDPERKELLEDLDVKEKILSGISKEVLKYKECDPEVLGLYLPALLSAHNLCSY